MIVSKTSVYIVLIPPPPFLPRPCALPAHWHPPVNQIALICSWFFVRPHPGSSTLQPQDPPTPLLANPARGPVCGGRVEGTERVEQGGAQAGCRFEELAARRAQEERWQRWVQLSRQEEAEVGGRAGRRGRKAGRGGAEGGSGQGRRPTQECVERCLSTCMGVLVVKVVG